MTETKPSHAERYTVPPALPRPPRFKAPPQSCDTHAHIFASPDLYPIHDRSMPLAPIDLYGDVHERLGVERGVLVQGGAYRHDNRAMVDALRSHPATLRGVALVPADITDAALRDLKEAGVVALRFTRGGASRVGDLRGLAPRMREMGFHAELFVGFDAFAELQGELLGLGLPLVLDHLAGPFDTSLGLAQRGFQNLLSALDDGQIWIKLTPQRNAKQKPSYEDVRPFFDALIARRPDRMVWGSDWPFPNMGAETPDVSDLLDLFAAWVSDHALQHGILVDNAAHLYGFNSL